MPPRPSRVLRSCKAEGAREGPIIRRLEAHFAARGFAVVPRARLNIAWGSVISDVDMLLFRDGQMGAVEVKARGDGMRRAAAQVDRLRDYVDFAYVAADYVPRRFDVPGAGLICVRGRVAVLRAPRRLAGASRPRSVGALYRECLLRMAEASGARPRAREARAGLARIAAGRPGLRAELQEIVACGLGCESACPIRGFARAPADQPLYGNAGARAR